MSWIFNPFTGTLDFAPAAGGGGTGDITAVSAGTGLSGGGTSGSVTLSLADTAVAAGSYTYTALTVDAQGRITSAANATVSATDKLLGRSSAGAGNVEEIDCTAAGRALLDDADAAAQRTTLAAAGTGVANTFTAAQTITVTDNSNPALKVTQAGTGDALVVEDVASDTTPFKVDATGKVTAGGDVELNDGGSFTTTLQTVTPTADRTISLPNATGTVALVAGSSGQLIYNNAGAYAGTTSTWDSTNGTRYILPFGYGTGAGGTVTQATNKSTGVTLNTRCGQITMNNANLVTNTSVTFTLTNSAIAATDILMLNHVSGGTLGTYSFVARCAAGSATIAVRNVTAGDLAEAVVIAFAVIKATTS